ncbi:MAG: pyridoxine 5'-phosphate synthase [Opitutales bacterium]
MAKPVTKLSVNVNKFALLRNSRGRNFPNVRLMAKRCLDAGAQGITVHPRPDERHIRYADVPDLCPMVQAWGDDTEFNIEGYPGDRFLDLVVEHRPDQVTLVPDAPDQITSDHGWPFPASVETLKPIIGRLKEAGIRTSLFLDPDPGQVAGAAETGADRVELYTEGWAAAFDRGDADAVLKQYAATARAAQAAGLGVNAGHDLNLANLGPFLEAVPDVLEVSIGHALVIEAFDYGLEDTVDRYLKTIAGAEE